MIDIYYDISKLPIFLGGIALFFYIADIIGFYWLLSKGGESNTNKYFQFQLKASVISRELTRFMWLLFMCLLLPLQITGSPQYPVPLLYGCGVLNMIFSYVKIKKGL